MPDLEPDDLFYWDAFQALSTDRGRGDLPGPIPWTAQRAFAMDAGLSDEQTQDFYTIISIMDKEFLDFHHKRHEKHMEDIKRQAKRARKR